MFLFMVTIMRAHAFMVLNKVQCPLTLILVEEPSLIQVNVCSEMCLLKALLVLLLHIYMYV